MERENDTSLLECYSQQVKASNIYRNCILRMAQYLSSKGDRENAQMLIKNLEIADERVKGVVR